MIHIYQHLWCDIRCASGNLVRVRINFMLAGAYGLAAGNMCSGTSAEAPALTGYNMSSGLLLQRKGKQTCIGDLLPDAISTGKADNRSEICVRLRGVSKIVFLCDVL
jgi:hypothetical protein